MAIDAYSAPAQSDTSVRSHMLAVGDGHELYVETSGAPDGIPAVYLHGGPGSGCQAAHRRLFDRKRFRSILFDQRGSGRSTPSRCRIANTTQHLIADMELIRETFGFEKWLVVGGSWGATLALAYAEAYPQRVSGLVLRATFLGTRAELEDAFYRALPRHFPELNSDFLSLLSERERRSPLDAYWARILDDDPAIHVPAARAWNGVESILSEVAPKRSRLDLENLSAPARQPAPATPYMEAHYFVNDCFMQSDQLLRNASALRNTPGVIVQARYDLLCPPSVSRALKDVWPLADIAIVETAGHSLFDPGVYQAVTKAITDLAY